MTCPKATAKKSRIKQPHILSRQAMLFRLPYDEDVAALN
jgi:hypothetical protein